MITIICCVFTTCQAISALYVLFLLTIIVTLLNKSHYYTILQSKIMGPKKAN